MKELRSKFESKGAEGLREKLHSIKIEFQNGKINKVNYN